MLITLILKSNQVSVGLERKLERHIIGRELLKSVLPKITRNVIQVINRSVSVNRTSTLFMVLMLKVTTVLYLAFCFTLVLVLVQAYLQIFCELTTFNNSCNSFAYLFVVKPCIKYNSI